MGKSERLFADSGGLTGHDVAQLAKDGLAPQPAGSIPIHGYVLRHGQVTPFTLDTSQPVPEPTGIVIEQVAITALLMASCIGPIYHLMG